MVLVRHIQVGILNGKVVGRVPQPEFVGVVVEYWRNGLWIVRELEHGTTCAYPAAELTKISQEE